MSPYKRISSAFAAVGSLRKTNLEEIATAVAEGNIWFFFFFFFFFTSKGLLRRKKRLSRKIRFRANSNFDERAVPRKRWFKDKDGQKGTSSPPGM